jgi:protein-disulfide isomerase
MKPVSPASPPQTPAPAPEPSEGLHAAFTRFDVYLALVIFVGALVTGVAYLDSGQREILRQMQQVKAAPQQRTPQQAAALAPAPPPAPVNFDLPVSGAPFKGSSDAKLAFVEFSDFQCSFCGKFTRETLPLIERDYVATGKVRLIFKNLPLPMHPDAEKAAEAGECAKAQGKFWDMHDKLFANQGALGVAILPSYATQIGLNASQFTSCFNGAMTAKVKADLDAGIKLGMGGTPYFMVGTLQKDGSVHVLERIVFGAAPYADFKKVLDRQLADPMAR